MDNEKYGRGAERHDIYRREKPKDNEKYGREMPKDNEKYGREELKETMRSM